MTPDAMRDKARSLDRIALRTLCSSTDPYMAGRSSAFHQAAQFLRRDAAWEDGFDVSVLLDGPRGIAFGREFPPFDLDTTTSA